MATVRRRCEHYYPVDTVFEVLHRGVMRDIRLRPDFDEPVRNDLEAALSESDAQHFCAVRSDGGLQSDGPTSGTAFPSWPRHT